jgi:CheY-like chemotaxis protein
MSEAAPKQSFGFGRRVALARAAAAVEVVWPALWPAIAIVGLFLVVSLFGIWAWLPGWLHAFGLFSFAGALGYAVEAYGGRLERAYRHLLFIRPNLILIVDDSPTEVHVMQKALERHGYQTASASDGLCSGSEVLASRAATSMARMYLANCLPRFLSCAALRCLMLAHLLWPAMRCLSCATRLVADG